MKLVVKVRCTKTGKAEEHKKGEDEQDWRSSGRKVNLRDRSKSESYIIECEIREKRVKEGSQIKFDKKKAITKKNIH